MAEKELGELIFLRYAFPAIGYCGKDITGQEILEFKEMLKSNGLPSRKRLEEIFPNAAKHLKDWEPKSVRDYWLGKHNEIVKDNPLCKVYAVEVQEVLPPQNGEVCRIGMSFGLEAKSYILLKAGDIVSIHILQVAEKLSKRDINQYFG